MPEFKDPLASFIEAENKLGTNIVPETEVKLEEEKKIEVKPEITEVKAEVIEEKKPEIVEDKKDELIDLNTSEETQATTTPDFDFQSLVKDLGVDVKTKEELASKWKELETKVTEDPLKGVPDNLRKAVEFAKQGGDFLQMLKVSQVDYSQIDPVVLYESQITSQIGDKEKAKEYLDSLSPLAKEIEGQKLKTQYIQWQESQEKSMKAELDAKAAQEHAKRIENEQRLRETVNKVDNIDGFKIKPSEKATFIKEVLDGSLSKELFMDDKGAFDYNKMLRVRFISKNFDAIKKHYGDMVKTSTKKEIITNLTNADLQTNSIKPEGKPQEYTNPLDHWIAAEQNKVKK